MGNRQTREPTSFPKTERLGSLARETDAVSVVSSHINKEEQALAGNAVSDYTAIDWLKLPRLALPDKELLARFGIYVESAMALGFFKWHIDAGHEKRSTRKRSWRRRWRSDAENEGIGLCETLKLTAAGKIYLRGGRDWHP